MKLKLFTVSGFVFVGLVFLSAQNAQSQTTVAQPPAPPLAPTGLPAPPPGHPRPPRIFIYMRAISDLQMARAEMQHSPDDLGGHRDSAIAACDKALEELKAVQLVIRPKAPRPAPPPAAPPAAAPNP